MNTLELFVWNFMEKGGQLATAAALGQVPSGPTLALRLHLMEEELNEYKLAEHALNEWHQHATPGNILDDPHGAKLLAEVADALLDLLYVTTGAGIAWGFPLWPLMDEVQRSNMEKFGPGSQTRADGKVLKPKGWRPPDLVKILRATQKERLRALQAENDDNGRST